MKIKQSTTWQEIQTFGEIPNLTNTSRLDYNKVQAAATENARELLPYKFTFSEIKNTGPPAHGQLNTSRDLPYPRRSW
jgi:hypothetical protein